MSAGNWTSGGAGTPEVRLADWFSARPGTPEVTAMFAPPKPKRESPPKSKTPPSPPPPPPVSAETQERVALLAAALEEIAEARRVDKTHSMALILEVALAMAEQLAAGALAAEPGRLANIVEEALGLMDEDQKVRVRLHPEVIALFEATGSLSRITSVPGVEVAADPSVGGRGCIVESATQRVDARLETRLARLRSLLRADEGVER